MNWLVFSYSLPSKLNSKHRVSLWRRLHRFGAISPKTGVYVLPDREECAEAFQWLAQEVQEAKGEALVMKVEKFEGLQDSELVELFKKSCKKDYEELGREIEILERTLKKKSTNKTPHLRESIKRLRNQLSEIAAIDFFTSDIGRLIQNRLKALDEKLIPSTPRVIPKLSRSDYQNKTWVTRPRPHVDRLGCIWLIRKFIDLNVRIRYSQTSDKDEIPFDMKDAVLGHHQNLCSFETMIIAFNLKEEALKPIASIVHEIDLRDGQNVRPETEGVASILKGWLLQGLSDAELESRGITLFEGLYTSFKKI